MKTNAVVRIIIYALVIVLLVGLLCAGLGIGTLSFSLGDTSGDYKTGSGSVSADAVSRLEIDWAAGSVLIETADVDWISFQESSSNTEDNAMVYAVKNNTLQISYRKPALQIGFVSLPSKDLTVIVPKDWICKDLELYGAALEVQIQSLAVTNLDIGGASNTVAFQGALTTFNCDGAACQIDLVCSNCPKEIELDGAACQLDLTLPKSCGFQVQMDGLSCDFRSDFDYIRSDDAYLCSGDPFCRVNTNGLSCDVNIRKGE